MRILMLGMNHRTASVDPREKLALTADAAGAVIDSLRAAHPRAEVVLLSTCNRTELYIARPAHDPPDFTGLRDILARAGGITAEALTAATIRRENDQAVNHLFRVCAGLESMVLGEVQILGQVKRAYEAAAGRGAVGAVLHRVFQQAIAVAKQARTATGIDAGRLSVGSVAVDLARGVFERFDDKVVVGIGAGEIAKVAFKHFEALRPGRLWLTNRTEARAEELAARLGLGQPGRTSGSARPFEALDDLLVEADVLLTSTGAQQPIITAARFHGLLRRRRSRPIFIIDLALPRDVEPEVGTLPNVYLYNLDHLREVVEQTRGQRSDQVAQCEKILLEAVRVCMAEVQNRDIGQLIRTLHNRLHELGRIEQQRTARKLDGVVEAAEIQALLEEHTHRLVNKIFHLPLAQLDRRQPDAPLGFYAAALRRLFDLTDEPPEPPEPSESSETPEPSESSETPQVSRESPQAAPQTPATRRE